MGRVEQLPRNGSYFTKELAVARTSVVVVRDREGQVRAFYNVCRHRGNKLVWTDYHQEESSGVCRQFVCKYHGWRYDLDGSLNFVQQEQEFFNLDKADFGLVPVHCDVWAGFIFVNLAREPEQSLRDFLGPMVTRLENYPFEKQTERRFYLANEVKVTPHEDGATWFEVELSDAWVWDMYRPARFVSTVRVVTFKDVNVEALPEKEL